MNFMKKVKTLGLPILTASMILSSGIVFADISTGATVNSTTSATAAGTYSIEGKGTQADIAISIDIPTEFDFILNPYKVEGKDAIISPECTITNKSDVGIKVSLISIKGTIAAGSDAIFATQPISSTDGTSKKLFLWLNVDDGSGSGYATSYDSTKHGVRAVLKSTDTTILPESELGTLAYKNATIGTTTLKYKLEGSINSNATWTEEDTVTVTPVFSFTPVANS
jgi:hypothetical protein